MLSVVTVVSHAPSLFLDSVDNEVHDIFHIFEPEVVLHKASQSVRTQWSKPDGGSASMKNVLLGLFPDSGCILQISKVRPVLRGMAFHSIVGG